MGNSLDFMDQAVCAQLVLPILARHDVEDTLTSQGVDVPSMRTRLREMLQSADLEEVHTDVPDSTYDRAGGKTAGKETPRNILFLLNALGKRTLTHRDVLEALHDCPKINMIEFIMHDVIGWKPTKKRQPSQRV